MLVHTSQIVAAVFAAIYIVLSIAIVILFEHKQNLHGMLSLCGTIVLGLGFLVFRLMRGFRTKMVKYVHFGVIMIGVLLLIGSLACVFTSESREKKYKSIHTIPGYVAYGSVAIELILAIFLFTYLYQRRQARHCFAPFHDIFGIWIYICLVGCFLAGHLSVDTNISAGKNEASSTTSIINYLSYLTFLIVIGVTLSPYFEWELIGDL